METADTRLSPQRSQWDGRVIVAAAAFAIALLLIVTGRVFGYDVAWKLVGVNHLSPTFSDTLVIVAGCESQRVGRDPLAENPADPWQRPMNYPRVWSAVCQLPITPAHVPVIGIGIAICFYAALLLFLGRLTPTEGVCCAVLACSPAVMLGVERGNIDLLIFVFVVAAIMARGWFSSALVLVCAVLKLYPICALSLGLRDSRRAFLLGSAAIAALFMVYLAVIWRDLPLIAAATPRSVFRSFGSLVLFQRYDIHFGSLSAQPISIACTAMTAIAGVAAVFDWPWLRQHDLVGRDVSVRFGGLYAGAAIYGGAFVLGNNYNYRLSFLLLMLPQLFAWAGPRNDARAFARVLLALIGIALLFSFYSHAWMFLPKELANWLLFAAAVALLVGGFISNSQRRRRS